MSLSQVTAGEDRILLVDGKRFFPIGARHLPVGGSYALLEQAGFNCVRWPVFGMDAYPTATFSLEVPNDLGGLKFYPYLWNRGDLAEDREHRQRELTELIMAVRDHPSLLCYEQRNEPAYTFRDPARPQSTPEGMIAGSRVIRELDPDHPIRVGHMVGNLVSTLRRYNPAVDIVGCNPYVVKAAGMRLFMGCRPDGLLVDSPNQTLSAVGDLTSKMMRVAEGRAVWMQLQAAANENWFSETHTPENRGTGAYEHHRLYPNRWQMRFMAFNAVIRGATALEWMLIRLPADSCHWQDVGHVVGELRDLHDVLSSPVWPGAVNIEYEEMGFSNWTGVEVAAKVHQGKPWILAANTQFDPMQAIFSNLPEGCGEKLEVYNEKRQVLVTAGTFSDRFQPYEVHVYSPEGSPSP